MPKPKLILWGNCQAGFLAEVLRASPEFMAAFELRFYRNFTRPGVFDYETCPAEELENCAVLLYHKVFTPQFVRAAAKRLEHLSARALRIPLPYLKCTLYWPFFDTASDPLLITPDNPWGVLPYRSPVLDDWIREGHDDEAIIRAFGALDPAEHLDLHRQEQETYKRWLLLERDSEGKLEFASFLMRNWRNSLLFYVQNHVAKPVLLHLANQILAQLDLPRLGPRDIARCDCGQHVTYPVHPGAARRYGIGFVKEGTRYSLNGKLYTFREFLRFYLAAARGELKPQAE